MRARLSGDTIRNSCTLKNSVLCPPNSPIKALGGIPDERAAQALAERVKDSQDRLTAANALRQMGQAAEETVIKLLDHDDYQVRYQACTVLGDIGGPKSIAALKRQLERDAHQWSRAAAEVALRKLEKGD